MDKDLKSMTFPQLEGLVAGLGQKKYVAGYIFSFIHTRLISDISAITPLSKPFRSELVKQGYYISKLEVADKLSDPDGTIKYFFELPDNKRVEAVLLYDDGRATLCVSTQVGCAMNCVFCATGRLGLARNLTAGEIVDQVGLVVRDASCVARANCEIRNAHDARRITNVVFMGMGEPLANYEAALNAVRILNHPAGRKIGIRRITISTCGLPPGIERLADEDVSPRLAISLNAPTDAIRQKLMPITRKYPLDRLFEALKVYQRKTRNRVTFEYCLIKGVNDTVMHAKMLVKCLRPFMPASTRPRVARGGCNVNLIEYNPYESCALKPSAREAIERFAGVLRNSGFETTIRRKFGQTIKAACGQLGTSIK
ncbi:MAG: 23S rRNA (adenine(2503)-C(2))-methyltransferase RlmN [Sedimentisphaerales bacterium]|nr:23S rRNA (adenine(2503)-C(2))-methyltransferase RlmN [Sedimentisphaerales bacterium]